MFRIKTEALHSGDKAALLSRWERQAEQDPQQVLEDRLARAAFSAVAMDDPANQDALRALMLRRGVPKDHFAAMQAVLCHAEVDEAIRRLEIEKILAGLAAAAPFHSE